MQKLLQKLVIVPNRMVLATTLTSLKVSTRPETKAVFSLRAS
jgi:hypothetical protein